MNNSIRLKELISSAETLIMPDAYDPISARIIEYLGYKAVQCSGYSFSIAACKVDETDIDLNENLYTTSKIVDSVSIPVMADGEDGFGGVEQIPDVIRRYVNAGVSGLNIEDQVQEKSSLSKIIDSSTMLKKIKVAKISASQYGNPDLIINARTDALNSYKTRSKGLKEAIRRANLYLEAGADLAFVTHVRDLDEVKLLAKEIHGPLSIAAGLTYNINNFTINDLQEIGIARVSLPTIAISSIVKALIVSIDSLKKGNFKDLINHELLCNSDDIMRLINK